MHHPMYSSGERHGPKTALRRALEPLFVKYGVDVVFAGHEHFYERMRPQGGIVTSSRAERRSCAGATSAGTRRSRRKGFDSDRSFTLAEIVGDQMYLETVSRMGTIVDSTVITRREVLGSSSE